MGTEFGKLLLDESPDAVIATTPEGKVLYWSKGAEGVFGYTSQEAIGRFLNDIIVPSDRTAEEAKLLTTNYLARTTGYSAATIRRAQGAR